MSTFTSQPPNSDDPIAALDRTLDQLRSGPEEALLVEQLSDLDRAAAAHLRERWELLPPERRLQVVRAMVTDAEENIARNYHRAMLVALDDSSSQTRLAALEGLWELTSNDFLHVLLTKIELEPSAEVRAMQALALGRYAMQAELGQLNDADAAAVRSILLRLVQADTSDDVRRRALEALGYFSGDEQVVNLIGNAYETGAFHMRVSAIHAMGLQSDPRWLENCYAELESDEPELRFEAVSALGTIGEQRAVPRIIDALTDTDPEVRLAAIRALGELGGHMAVNALRRLARDDDPATAEAADAALEEALLQSHPLRPLF
jgi:HEAT repeat protein